MNAFFIEIEAVDAQVNALVTNVTDNPDAITKHRELLHQLFVRQN